MGGNPPGPFGGEDPDNPVGGPFAQDDPNNPMGGLFGGDQFIGGINRFNPMDDIFGIGRPLNPSDDPENPARELLYNRQNQSSAIGGITTSGPINIYGNGINNMDQDGISGIGTGPDSAGLEEPRTEFDENGTPIIVDTGTEELRAEFDENGEPIVVTPGTEEPRAEFDENGEPIVVDTGAGEPRAEFDENGEPILVDTGTGEPTAEFDENGNPIIEHTSDVAQQIGSQEFNGEQIGQATQQIGSQELSAQQIGQAAQQMNGIEAGDTQIGQAAQQINGAQMDAMHIDQAMQQINGAQLGNADSTPTNRELPPNPNDKNEIVMDENGNIISNGHEDLEPRERMQSGQNEKINTSTSGTMYGINAGSVNINSNTARFNAQSQMSENKNAQGIGNGQNNGKNNDNKNEDKNNSIGNILKDITQRDFNSVLGIKDEPNSKLKSVYDALTSSEARNEFSEVRAAMHGFTDSLYVPGTASGDWKVSVDRFNEKTKIMQEKKLNNFINNPNNISAMIEQKNLKDKYDDKGHLVKSKEEQAQELLKEAAPFIDRGITDVNKINGLMELSKSTGLDVDSTLRASLIKDGVVNGNMPTGVNLNLGKKQHRFEFDKIPLNAFDGLREGVKVGKEQKAMIDFTRNPQNRKDLVEHVLKTTSFTPEELQNEGSKRDRIDKEIKNILLQGSKFIVEGKVQEVGKLIDYTKINSELSKYNVRGSSEDNKLKTIEAIDKKVENAIQNGFNGVDRKITIDPNIKISADSRSALESVMNNELARRTGNVVVENNGGGSNSTRLSSGNGGETPPSGGAPSGNRGGTPPPSGGRGGSTITYSNPKIQQTINVNPDIKVNASNTPASSKIQQSININGSGGRTTVIKENQRTMGGTTQQSPRERYVEKTVIKEQSPRERVVDRSKSQSDIKAPSTERVITERKTERVINQKQKGDLDIGKVAKMIQGEMKNVKIDEGKIAQEIQKQMGNIRIDGGKLAEEIQKQMGSIRIDEGKIAKEVQKQIGSDNAIAKGKLEQILKQSIETNEKGMQQAIERAMSNANTSGTNADTSKIAQAIAKTMADGMAKSVISNMSNRTTKIKVTQSTKQSGSTEIPERTVKDADTNKTQKNRRKNNGLNSGNNSN